MLRVNKLPEILREALTDGIEGVVLMTNEGSTLGSEFKDSSLTETVLAAISSSMWNNYSREPPSSSASASSASSATSPELDGPSLQIVKMENGTLGICRAGDGYLISAFGRDVTLGMLKFKLQALSGYFAKVFEQLK